MGLCGWLVGVQGLGFGAVRIEKAARIVRIQEGFCCWTTFFLRSEDSDTNLSQHGTNAVAEAGEYTYQGLCNSKKKDPMAGHYR